MGRANFVHPFFDLRLCFCAPASIGGVLNRVGPQHAVNPRPPTSATNRLTAGTKHSHGARVLRWPAWAATRTDASRTRGAGIVRAPFRQHEEGALPPVPPTLSRTNCARSARWRPFWTHLLVRQHPRSSTACARKAKNELVLWGESCDVACASARTCEAGVGIAVRHTRNAGEGTHGAWGGTGNQ